MKYAPIWAKTLEKMEKEKAEGEMLDFNPPSSFTMRLWSSYCVAENIAPWSTKCCRHWECERVIMLDNNPISNP